MRVTAQLRTARLGGGDRRLRMHAEHARCYAVLSNPVASVGRRLHRSPDTGSRSTRRHRPEPVSPSSRCRLAWGDCQRDSDVCFSNRPFGVKHFQTIHHHSVDVARGLVLLFGIGTRALPSWDSRTRWNNLYRGLAARRRQVQADMRTHLIHRPARDIFPRLGGTSSFLLSHLVTYASHDTAASRVQRNSVPSTHM